MDSINISSANNFSMFFLKKPMCFNESHMLDEEKTNILLPILLSFLVKAEEFFPRLSCKGNIHNFFNVLFNK